MTNTTVSEDPSQSLEREREREREKPVWRDDGEWETDGNCRETAVRILLIGFTVCAAVRMEGTSTARGKRSHVVLKCGSQCDWNSEEGEK
jgi:hypothetical protein